MKVPNKGRHGEQLYGMDDNEYDKNVKVAAFPDSDKEPISISQCRTGAASNLFSQKSLAEKDCTVNHKKNTRLEQRSCNKSNTTVFNFEWVDLRQLMH